VLNFSFISLSNALRLHLLTNSIAGSSTSLDNPMMCAINYVSLDTGGSTHKVSSRMQLSTILMHKLTFSLVPKCGISNKFRVVAFCSLVTHSCGSSRIYLVLNMILEYKYLSHAMLEKFYTSEISWSMNFSVATFPSISPSTMTAGGIYGITSGYFPSTDTITYGVVSFLGRM
jgi:hypothetical protein